MGAWLGSSGVSEGNDMQLNFQRGVKMKLLVNDVSKSIGGKAVLSNVSLCLESGNVYGFSGRNGSGKTMLFRALSGLMKTDSGTVVWNGRTVGKDFSVLPGLGIVLENAALFPDLTGMQNLMYLAGLTRRIGRREIEGAMARAGLDPADKRAYRKYSLGMKQRLAVAQAVMEKPDVLMLDEPTNGLDDAGVEKIRQIILKEKERGALILLASHNKEDMALLADTLYRMENGRVAAQEAGDGNALP